MKIEVNKNYKNVISIELTGENITKEQIEKIEETVAALHEKIEDVHFIILVGAHSHMSIKAIYEALKLVIKERKFIHKIAIVAHSNFIKVGAKLDNLTLPWQEKYFDIDEVNEAWNWITTE